MVTLTDKYAGERAKIYVVSNDPNEVATLFAAASNAARGKPCDVIVFTNYYDAKASYCGSVDQAYQTASKIAQEIIPRRHLEVPSVMKRPLVVVVGADDESGFHAGRFADIIRSDNNHKSMVTQLKESYQTKVYRFSAKDGDYLPDNIKNPDHLYDEKFNFVFGDQKSLQTAITKLTDKIAADIDRAVGKSGGNQIMGL